MSQCLQTNGGNSSSCACALDQVEQTVPYATAVAAVEDISGSTPPAWYRDAIASCS